jgi:hypothetical protein
MSLTHIITCDACRSPKLFGSPHLTVGMRPAFYGARRDLHFCDEACLSRFTAQLGMMLDEHAKVHNSTRAPR